MEKILYKEGYKYQNMANVSFYPHFDFQMVFDKKILEKNPLNFLLLRFGNQELVRIEISKGYAWDGASGPTIDSPEILPASLGHDVLYQLLRYYPELFLNHEKSRNAADLWLRDKIYHDGKDCTPPKGATRKERLRCFVVRKTAFLRSRYYYLGVKYGGKFAADPENKKEVLIAP